MGGGVVRGAGRGGPEGRAAEGAGEERAGKEFGEEDAKGEDEGGGVVIRFTSTLQEEAYTYGACTEKIRRPCFIPCRAQARCSCLHGFVTRAGSVPKKGLGITYPPHASRPSQNVSKAFLKGSETERIRVLGIDIQPFCPLQASSD